MRKGLLRSSRTRAILFIFLPASVLYAAQGFLRIEKSIRNLPVNIGGKRAQESDLFLIQVFLIARTVDYY
jgi:hypothetical protein